LTGRRLLDRDNAVDRILDGAITGAAAEVSLQRARQIQLLRVGEGRRCHDHSGRCRSRTGSRGVAELPLQRMHVLRRAEALDRRHLAIVGAERRRDAAVHGVAVQPHGARPTITCVTTLLDAVVAERAYERAQTLAGTRLFVEGLAVYRVRHDHTPALSSIRISSA
jgi:hypothetical protein